MLGSGFMPLVNMKEGIMRDMIVDGTEFVVLSLARATITASPRSQGFTWLCGIGTRFGV